MKHYSIKELNEISNKEFVLRLLYEELNARTNAYSPVANKLRSAISELENQIEVKVFVKDGIVDDATKSKNSFTDNIMIIVYNVDTDDYDKKLYEAALESSTMEQANYCIKNLVKDDSEPEQLDSALQ